MNIEDIENMGDEVLDAPKTKSLGKVKTQRERLQIEPVTPTPIRDGEVEIDKEELGERAQFYPDSWRFFIKPASTNAIKNWSSIDEENLLQVNTALNEILKTCLKIKDEFGSVPWNRINSWDRFWFLLKIREYTFMTGENTIKFDAPCDHCDNPVHYTLTSDSLVFNLPDREVIDQHWDSNSRCWIIDPKEYDVEHPVVQLYSPTLERDELILAWVQQREQAKKDTPSGFIQALPWMFKTVSREPKVNDRSFVEAEGKYKAWSVDMYNFMMDVLENIVIKPSEQLRQLCSHCGEEVISNIEFPADRGVKSLFTVQNRHKKFGSK